MAYLWVYESNKTWVPFDPQSNVILENLYRTGVFTRVFLPYYGRQIFCNPRNNFIIVDTARVTIARTGY